MRKTYELQKRYFVHWNPLLQFGLSSQSDDPKLREQALQRWDDITGAATGLKHFDQLIGNLIGTFCDQNASLTLRARAIFCLLWHDLRMSHADQIRGPLIAKHLGINGLPEYLLTEPQSIPWHEVPNELNQFVIETIVLCLQHLRKDAEELRQWYGEQIICFASQKQDTFALEYLPEHFDVFRLWEEFLVQKDLQEQLKRDGNQQLMNWLQSIANERRPEAKQLISSLAKLLYNRLTDRKLGIRYHACILREQICWLMKNCQEEFPEAENAVRLYLTQEAYYWLLKALDALDHTKPAFHDTQKAIVEFFVAGGVHPPQTEPGHQAITMMREIAIKESWTQPVIALGMALGMCTQTFEPTSTEAMAQ